MNDLLKSGQILPTLVSGQPCEIQSFLGSGGQGEVYRVRWGGNEFALKWYFPQTATEDQWEALRRLVETHRCPSDAFLWPLDLLRVPGIAGFGYVMRLREKRYRSLLDLMMGRADPSFQTRVTAGLRLVDCFFQLHSEGLCYCDISFGNAFFDPQLGDVLICDNDNVRENRPKKVAVLGTPDFMAPEIIRGEALPSRQTDLYSLSVLLFYMFHVSHPLQGKRLLSIRSWDYPARKKLFGEQPLFIFDPHDASNQAVGKDVDPLGEAGASALSYWPIYPAFIRAAFTRAFTTGLTDPDGGRVLEGEWRQLLSRLRDAIALCPGCKSQNFYDDEAAPADRKCWSCRKPMIYPFRMKLGKTEIVLNLGARLYSHHLDDRFSDFDFTTNVAEVISHPSDPKIWGLRNNSASKWVVTLSDGSVREIEPKQSVRLAGDSRIHFGKIEGTLIR